MTSPPAGSQNDGLRQRFEERKAEIRAMDDLVEAVRAADALGQEMAVFRSEAAKLRSEMANRLKETEKLSVQGLGNALGVTKPTAQQILGKPRQPDSSKRPKP